MPLTAKGNEIMKAMQKQYGETKGESVFYASKNAGKISGVDRADMSAGEFDALRDLFDEFMAEEAQEPEHKDDAAPLTDKQAAFMIQSANSCPSTPEGRKLADMYRKAASYYRQGDIANGTRFEERAWTFAKQNKIGHASLFDDAARPVDQRFLAVQADRSGRLDAACKVMDAIGRK